VPIAVRILIATVAVLVLYLIAVKIIRVMLAPPPPDEPDLEAIRPVDYQYRCMVCGAEVTMTAAPDEDVEAPRHCREDMVGVDH